MNPYALPSIIAIVPYVVLGLTVLLLNPRDRTARWLGILSLSFACVAAAVAVSIFRRLESRRSFGTAGRMLLCCPVFLRSSSTPVTAPADPSDCVSTFSECRSRLTAGLRPPS